MKELNYDEMKELLSDYSFGKLTQYEISIFEANIDNYPELKNEVIEIRSAFSNLNKKQIKERIERKTVNLSYKVNQNKYSKQRNKNLWFSVIKFSIPVLLLGFTYVYVQQDQEYKPAEKNEKLESAELVSEVDFNIIIGDIDNINSFNEVSQLNTIEVNDGLLQISNSEIDELNLLESMSESEFNELLDEISDEKINL
jgi:hypothetical protein